MINKFISNPHLVRCVDKPKYLLEVLQNMKFVCRYSSEHFSEIIEQSNDVRFGIPMVCFCDVPDHSILSHADKGYGHYYIYMKKEWGRKYELLPIHYVHKGTNNFRSCFTNLYSLITEGVNNRMIEDTFIRLLSYSKPYDEYELQTNITYYDEREWRFIPKNLSLDLILKLKNGTEINNVEQERLKDLAACNLEFTNNDIIKIVVPNINSVSEKDMEDYNKLVSFINESGIRIITEENNKEALSI